MSVLMKLPFTEYLADFATHSVTNASLFKSKLQTIKSSNHFVVIFESNVHLKYYIS